MQFIRQPWGRRYTGTGSVQGRPGSRIGKACAEIATFLSPEAFIFFGGLAQAGELLMKPMKEAYDKNVLSLYKNKAKFLTSGLEGATAAILGASAIGWNI